jgi:phage shock protein A
MSVNQEMSISKDLKSMKMRNECLENSIKNIKEMYTKARKNVEECVKKNKDLEEKLENMSEEMKRMEENKE